MFNCRVADLGGIASVVTSTKNGLYVKRGREKKSTNYRNYVQHGFQTYTHPDGLIDEPNESPKIKGGK